MKRFLITYLIMLSSFALWGQNNHLSGLHGLKNDKGDIFLEIAGYDIAIYTEAGSIDNTQTMASIKKSFHMEDILIEGSNPSIDVKNKVLEATSKPYNQSDINIYQICVCLQEAKDKITIIYFETFNNRDITLEKEVINAYLNNKISTYISPYWGTATADFAGKKVILSHLAEWLKPHELSYETAQVKWSEFSSLEKARLNTNNQMTLDKADNVEVLSIETIPLYFDHIELSSKRIVYKDLSSSSLDPLVAYYIADEINGHYISCILSHYITNKNDYLLPQLLRDFVRVTSSDNIQKNTDTYAQNQPQNYKSEKNTKSQSADRKQERESENRNRNHLQNQKRNDKSENKPEPPKLYACEFRAGVWLPLGGWSYFGESFSWSVFGGLPIKQKGMLDFGLNIVHTDYPYLFYYIDNQPEVDEVECIVNLILRYRYHQKISRNTLLIPYIGGEWSFIESGVDFKDQVKVFGGFAGMTYRYKRMGLFLEYHYTPYNMSGKLRNNFHSSIQVGASLSFFSY